MMIETAKHNKEILEAERIARHYPLGEYCELCPDNDKRKATQRAHLNYVYPTIFLSLCNSCHKWCDRKHASTYKGNTKIYLKQARLFAIKLGLYDKYFDKQGKPLDKSMYKQLRIIRVMKGNKLIGVKYE